MKVFLVFALFAVAASINIPFNRDLDQHWENFKRIYEKTYTGREEAEHRFAWEEHVGKIIHHNLRADLGLHSFRRGLNKYADVKHEEYVKIMNKSKRINAVRNGSGWVNTSNVEIPDTVDWRTKGLVTGVKDQIIHKCGSCWAFSVTGSLEGQNKKKTGELVSLSEQNLVDCSRPQGNHGCEGGLQDSGFRYIIQNKGIDTEKSYPYIAQDGTCQFKKENVGATVYGFVDLPVGDEEALKIAVATVGPISVAIDGNHDSFLTYKNGIYDEPACSSVKLCHAVLAVGYGTEDGKDYWLVKNSFGPTWGINGYIKMSRNANNQCGIATEASYPLV